jgi:CubicO group peptidase (beta-lactamase class C family)
MQQVERGALDLDRDINDYLDFRIPPAFGKPITLRHLMTHTPGFEDTTRDVFVASAEDLYPLSEYLKRHMPARIFPPGEIVAYSNYGAGIAGFILERVSGQPYEIYIDANILQPLRMHHSSVAQPLPPDLAALMAGGYRSRSSGTAQPFEVTEIAPAGSLSSSAIDIGRFMVAHLQEGRLGDDRILRPETVRLMHATQRTSAAGLNGFTLGFFEENRNGHRIIGHSGDTAYFHSDLHLIPDSGVGFYVSFNSEGREGGSRALRKALFRVFLDRFFPRAGAEPAPTYSATNASAVAGAYLSSRHNESALKLRMLLDQVEIVARPDGTIQATSWKDVSGAPIRWVEISPFAFREMHGQSRLMFILDSAQRVSYAATDDGAPIHVLQRLPAWQRRSVIFPLIAGSGGVLLASLLVSLGGFLIRRHYGRSLTSTPGERRLRVLSRLAVVLTVGAICGWAALTLQMTLSDSALQTDWDSWLYGLYVLTWATVISFIAIAANGIATWRALSRNYIAKIGEWLVVIAAASVVWIAIAFQLLNFSTHY